MKKEKFKKVEVGQKHDLEQNKRSEVESLEMIKNCRQQIILKGRMHHDYNSYEDVSNFTVYVPLPTKLCELYFVLVI